MRTRSVIADAIVPPTRRQLPRRIQRQLPTLLSHDLPDLATGVPAAACRTPSSGSNSSTPESPAIEMPSSKSLRAIRASRAAFAPPSQQPVRRATAARTTRQLCRLRGSKTFDSAAPGTDTRSLASTHDSSRASALDRARAGPRRSRAPSDWTRHRIASSGSLARIAHPVRIERLAQRYIGSRSSLVEHQMHVVAFLDADAMLARNHTPTAVHASRISSPA